MEWARPPSHVWRRQRSTPLGRCQSLGRASCMAYGCELSNRSEDRGARLLERTRKRGRRGGSKSHEASRKAPVRCGPAPSGGWFLRFRWVPLNLGHCARFSVGAAASCERDGPTSEARSEADTHFAAFPRPFVSLGPGSAS
jgi:hypothetical protein